MRNAVWIVLAVLLALTACGALSCGELVLPDPEDLERAAVTGGGMNWTATDAGAIAGLVEALEQAAGNTRRASVQDVPSGGTGLVRIDFYFKGGGASAAFLYWEDGVLLFEQPYQGIYEMDGALEERLQAVLEKTNEQER